MDRLKQIKQRIRVMEPRVGLPGAWEDELYWLVQQVERCRETDHCTVPHHTTYHDQLVAQEKEIERLREENTQLKDAIEGVVALCEGTPKRPFRAIVERLSPLLGREAS